MSIGPRDFVISYNQLYGLYNPVYTVIPMITSPPPPSSSMLYNEYKLLNYEYHSKRLKQIISEVDEEFDSIILKECKNEIITKINESERKNNKYGYGLITICCHSDEYDNINCKSLYSPSLGYNYYNDNADDRSYTYIADMFMHIRKNPILKACSWPEERIYVEKQKDAKSIETILYHEHNDDYILTEGLTSNLYCLDNKGENLYTASSNLALPGSMGYIVESVCRSTGINVINEAISLSKIVNEEFDLFLTSATKPVQKLSCLIHPNKATKTNLPSHESISGKSINQIRVSVLQEIKKRFTNCAPL